MINVVEILVIACIAIYIHQYLVIPTLSAKKLGGPGNKVSEIMERDGLSFEDARDKLLTQKLAKVIEVEKDTYVLGKRTIKQGDRVSFFNTDENNYTIGDFVGSKASKAEGYTDHICIRVDGKVLFLPVEVIDLSTLRIYER